MVSKKFYCIEVLKDSLCISKKTKKDLVSLKEKKGYDLLFHEIYSHEHYSIRKCIYFLCKNKFSDMITEVETYHQPAELFFDLLKKCTKHDDAESLKYYSERIFGNSNHKIVLLGYNFRLVGDYGAKNVFKYLREIDNQCCVENIKDVITEAICCDQYDMVHFLIVESGYLPAKCHLEDLCENSKYAKVVEHILKNEKKKLSDNPNYFNDEINILSLIRISCREQPNVPVLKVLLEYKEFVKNFNSVIEVMVITSTISINDEILDMLIDANHLNMTFYFTKLFAEGLKNNADNLDFLYKQKNLAIAISKHYYEEAEEMISENPSLLKNIAKKISTNYSLRFKNILKKWQGKF